jgi:hypothetical protein
MEGSEGKMKQPKGAPRKTKPKRLDLLTVLEQEVMDNPDLLGFQIWGQPDGQPPYLIFSIDPHKKAFYRHKRTQAVDTMDLLRLVSEFTGKFTEEVSAKDVLEWQSSIAASQQAAEEGASAQSSEGTQSGGPDSIELEAADQPPAH